MKRRIAFRWWLPVIQLFLAATLIYMGRAEERAAQGRREFASWQALPSSVPNPTQICMAINTPASLATWAIGKAIEKTLRIDLPYPMGLIIFGLALLAVWSPVGLYLDRKTGLAKRIEPRQPSFFHFGMAITALLIQSLLALFALVLALKKPPSDVRILWIGILIWSLFGIAMTVGKLRQLKNHSLHDPRHPKGPTASGKL